MAPVVPMLVNGIMMHAAVENRTQARAAASFGALALLACCALLVGSGSEMPLTLAVTIALVPFLGYWALVRPLVFPFGLYVVLIPFDNLLVAGSSVTVTKILGIAAGLFLLLWVARTRNAVAPDRSFTVLFAFFVWACASVLWAVDQQAAIAILPSYGGLILLYGALSIARITMQQYRMLVYFVIAGGLAAAIYGANAFYHQPAMAAQANDGRLVVQAGGNFIDPNHFADALLFPASALIMLAVNANRLPAKILSFAGLCAIVVAIVLSGSREGLVGLAVVLLYFAWRSRYRMQIAIAGAVSIAGAFSVQTSLWERFASALSTGGSGRTSIWAVGLEAARQNWLAGYGIGTFPSVYDMYYISVYQYYTNGWSSPAHNIVVHYLVELGIVGLLLLAAFLWLRFSTLRGIPKESPLYGYRLMMEAALLALITVSLSIDLFTYKYAWLVFSMAALLRNLAPEAHIPAMRAQSSRMIAERR